jgi:hypothetical protein
MKLYHEDATGCSYDGASYERDATGAFDVPDEAAVVLLAHGFSTVDPGGSKPIIITVAGEPLTGNPAKWTKEILTAEAVRLGIDPEQARAVVVRAVAEARKVEADAAATEAEQDEAETGEKSAE